MKTRALPALIPALILALAFAVPAARADQRVTLIWTGMIVPVPGALARDGYVATHWAGPDAAHLKIIGVSCMMDAFNATQGKNFDGLGWYDHSKAVVSKPGATGRAVTRVFQYSPGVYYGTRTKAGESGDFAAENLDLNDLEAFWHRIQGTAVSRAEVGGIYTIDPMGLGTVVTVNYPAAPLTLTGTPGARPPEETNDGSK
jgi:putative globular PEP-CTERM protein (TIGR04254 family)